MSLTLHTSLGDLKIELDCELAPRLCENFIALAASEYYNGSVFHRNIAGFLLQGGDPTGTGKGGSSIGGIKLADEFHPALKVRLFKLSYQSALRLIFHSLFLAP